MNHLTKFESFRHRIPMNVSDQEYENKLNTHGKEPYNEIEMNFFRKLKLDNQMSIYDMYLGTPGKSDTIFLQLYPTGEGDELIEVDIIKLKDDWYLIYEPGNEKFICDEWDEVLGYLGHQTTLKF